MSDSISQILKDINSNSIIKPKTEIEELAAIESQVDGMSLAQVDAVNNRLVQKIIDMGYDDKFQGKKLLDLPIGSIIQTYRNILTAQTAPTPTPATAAPATATAAATYSRVPCPTIKTRRECDIRGGNWRKGHDGKRGNCASLPYQGGCLPEWAPYAAAPYGSASSGLSSVPSGFTSASYDRYGGGPRLKKCGDCGYDMCASCKNDPDCVYNKKTGWQGRPYTVSDGLKYQWATDAYGRPTRDVVPTGTRRETWTPETPFL